MLNAGFQYLEQRDANDKITKDGVVGKNSSFSTSDNSGIYDIIAEDLRWLKENVDDVKDTSDLEAIKQSVTDMYNEMKNDSSFGEAAAKAQAEEAKKQAQAALESATNAKTYRDDVVTKSTEANDTLAEIKNYIDKAEKLVGSNKALEQSFSDYATVATNKAKVASDSATNAKASETNAAASEAAAKTSETNAKTSETNAAESAARAEAAIENLGTHEANAAASASNAKTSETNAKTSETNAKASETNSKTSETNAKASETNASNSADLARAWAESSESPDSMNDTDSTTGKTQSSKAWALYSRDRAISAFNSETSAATSAEHASASETKAKTSETNAKTSETNAKTSAVNSKASELSAETSASNAADSEIHAKASEDNAKASETHAKTSETNAKSSELKAKTSETNAATSEANASDSEAKAKTSETNAATSAEHAKASEANASASEVKAKTSETNAKTSETNAATSESNASASEINTKGYMEKAQTAYESAKAIQSVVDVAKADAEKCVADVEAVRDSLAKMMTYQGSVDNYSDLPENPQVGYSYNVKNADKEHGVNAGDNVVWNGESWDNLGGSVDMSLFAELGKDVRFNAVTATTFTGNLKGTADNATTADTATRATAADNANRLGGYPLNSYSIGGNWGTVPRIGTDGGMEVGKYIDWHPVNGGSADYTSRWEANSDGTVTVGTINGTLNGNAATATKATTADKVNNLGAKTAIKDGTREPDGLHLYQCYDNGYPTTYGNVISIGGAGGGELLAGWSGADKGIEHLYYRNRRDAGALWSDWRTVAFTSDINSYAPTKTGTGASGTWPISISGNAAGLSGSLSFPDIGNVATSNKISWSGSTDGADIYYQTTASDQGNLVLNLRDDANCYLRIAYNGAFKSYFTPADGNFHGNVNGTADTALNIPTSDVGGNIWIS